MFRLPRLRVQLGIAGSADRSLRLREDTLSSAVSQYGHTALHAPAALDYGGACCQSGAYPHTFIGEARCSLVYLVG